MGTKPPALRKGDLIAIVSPSGRLNSVFPHRISRAVTFLENSLGFRVKIIFDPSIDPSSSSLSSVKKRCEELHLAFRDKEVKGVICAIGGLSANELLRHLDYGLIRQNPKVFVGYSDITLLHHAFATQAGLNTFYGPAAIPQWGEIPRPLQFTTDHFLHMICGGRSGSGGVLEAPGQFPRSKEWTQEFLDWGNEEKSTARARQMQPSSGWRWLREGKARGKLTGGCLPSLVQLTGTPYLIPSRGCILVLETPEGESVSGPHPFDFARSNVADLINAGAFDGIAGLVLGRPFQYDEEMTRKFEEMVVEQCEVVGGALPILANVDVGHTDPMLTLPFGCEIVLDSEKDEFAVVEGVTV